MRVDQPCICGSRTYSVAPSPVLCPPRERSPLFTSKSHTVECDTARPPAYRRTDF